MLNVAIMNQPKTEQAYQGNIYDVFQQAFPNVRDEAIRLWESKTLEWLSMGSSSKPRSLLTIHQTNYPSRCQHLPDPPKLLFAEGHLSNLAPGCIAIVGSRNASRVGTDTAFHFARWLAEQGWCIVSGLAAGIDGAAHRGTLAANGRTIAVVGTGIDIPYPNNHKDLLNQIVDCGGLVLSEYPLGTPPRPAFFPRRNRIIAALCDGLVVVEAAPRSGSLITARLANTMGRIVMAVPGSIHSTHAKGCHAMIRSGAILVDEGRSIHQEVFATLPDARKYCIKTPMPNRKFSKQPDPITPPQTISCSVLNQKQERVYQCIGATPIDFDGLTMQLDLTPSDLLGILTELEFAGFILSESGERWVQNPYRG